jgi:ubiquinone/menaquinone biosynthesis C-methylase UbiE
MTDQADLEDDRDPASHVATSRRTYQRIAPVYDLLDLAFERYRYRALRPRLFQELSGVLLDAGIGTGRNIPVYPEASRVVGIDLSPAMLARAERRARRLGRVVQLRETDVCRTDFPADSFDGIVSSFLFCVLGPDQQLPALRELARICKPSGTLRILEYSLSTDPLRRFVMKLWAPWVRWAYGAAFDRNTENYVSQAGLEVVETTFLYHDIIKLIVARPLERQDE